MKQSIYHKVIIRFTEKKLHLSVCVFSDEVCFRFPGKNDGFQLHL